MIRRAHFAAERLSPQGLAIVHHGLRSKLTYGKILEDLRAATGERLAHSSLGRYASRWESLSQALQAAQEQAGAIVAEIKAGNLDAGQMATALVSQALFEAREGLAAADPIQLSREERERQKLAIQRDTNELKREQTAIERERLHLDRDKFEWLKANKAAVKKAAEGIKEIADGVISELTPEHRAKIRELYGLAVE